MKMKASEVANEHCRSLSQGAGSKIVATALVAFLLVLTGCSSEVSDLTENSDSNAQDETGDEGSSDESAAQDSDSSGGDEGVVAVAEGDPNPGAVPGSVLAEPTTVAAADIGGHKIFAGPEGPTPSNSSTVYRNLQFNCDGTGVWENWPEVLPTQGVIKRTEGEATWSLEDGKVVATIASIGGPGISFEEIGDRLTNDENFQVGETSLEGKSVTRIVQFEECP